MEGGTPGSTSSMNKIPKMQISSDKEEEKDDFFLATSQGWDDINLMRHNIEMPLKE